jgi:acetolactate synthase I/II/III large subunit
MSAPSHIKAAHLTGASAVVDALIRCGITTGFGIPSIHNIAVYEALRRQPDFHHWVARHEQAAGFAADGFYRRSGRPAAVFASTGPGNLFTLVPLLESFQTCTPVVLIGTNVVSPVLDKTCGALHETPQQIDIIKPLTRFAVRITSPDQIPYAVAAAAHAGGPAFIEIPHDVLLAPLDAEVKPPADRKSGAPDPEEMDRASALIDQSRKPVMVVGSGVGTKDEIAAVKALAEALQCPVLSTTSGKGVFPDDHPLAMGCISRLGLVQELLLESDLLISISARITEFDTGRFTLKWPAQHVQIIHDQSEVGLPLPTSAKVVGDLAPALQRLAGAAKDRTLWWNIAQTRAQEREKLESLKSSGYSALRLLRQNLDRGDVLANDQSILNYWASAFFPVLEPRTFLYPTGSGTLGYGLPAAVGAACALQQEGKKGRVVCIAGDGGFQYTAHELATLAQYNLPVKILLVNDNAYGIIGFLQRTMFGQTHEVALKNPDFCVLAEAFNVPAQRANSIEELERQLPSWLNTPGPALLEWRTQLKAPWEEGAIIRPAGIGQVPRS